MQSVPGSGRSALASLTWYGRTFMKDRPVPARTFLVMGSRLLAPGIALAALLADAGGVHGLASWLVLLALPAAAAAAFVGVSDALEGLGAMRAATASLALALLVLGSAVREGAPRGGSVPALAISAIVMALLCYAIPGLLWVLEPLASRPRIRIAPLDFARRPN
jgi:hypothetical protein